MRHATGMHLFVVVALTGCAAAETQQAASSDATPVLRQSFSQVSGLVTRAVDLVPADKYSYRPTESVRTFGELIAHIADSHNYYCARAGGRDVPWSDPVEKGVTDKTTVAAQLQQSNTACTAAYTDSADVAVLVENVAHTNLHYGNVITYMRMMGLVPPSSQ